MAINFGPIPDFSVKTPDITGEAIRAAQLKSLLGENTLRQSLAPLQIQEQQQKAQQAALTTQAQQMQNEIQQEQLQDSKALTKLMQEGDVRQEATTDFSMRGAIAGFTGIDPKDPMMGTLSAMATAGMSGRGLLAQAHIMLQARTEYNKGTEEQQKIIKDNYDVWKDATAQLFNADPKDRSIMTAQMLPRLQAATHLSPELDAMVTLLRQNPEMGVPIAYNLVAAQEKTLGLTKSAAEATVSQTAARKGVIELAALPQQLQDTHIKNVQETKRAAVETQLQTAQLGQLRQNEAYIRQPDASGFTTPLPVPEYNKRYDSFTNSPGYKQIQTLQGSYQQFGTILNDLDAGRPLTGAASVVALFNAIGISAEPLAGKGFRINSNTIQEHIGARGLDQSAYQKVLSLKSGDVITPQQVKDYASIAANVYKNAYVNSADEAHRQGLPADFLPRGGGKMIDSTTAKIYANVVAHQNPSLAANPAKLQQAAMAAARQNGWQVDEGQ